MENEIWKTVEGFEKYQVSNLGRVKSLSRVCPAKLNSFAIRPEKILKQVICKKGYLKCGLYDKNLNKKTIQVHKLVAICFLNHIPNGMKRIINHKDFNKQNNSVENLEIVTNRQNANFKHIPHSSKYTGVSWNKGKNKWSVKIYINKKSIHIGYFKNEYDAHLAYENKLLTLKE